MPTQAFLGQRESTSSSVLRLDPWGPRAPGKFYRSSIRQKGGGGIYFLNIDGLICLVNSTAAELAGILFKKLSGAFY